MILKFMTVLPLLLILSVKVHATILFYDEEFCTNFKAIPLPPVSALEIEAGRKLAASVVSAYKQETEPLDLKINDLRARLKETLAVIENEEKQAKANFEQEMNACVPYDQGCFASAEKKFKVIQGQLQKRRNDAEQVEYDAESALAPKFTEIEDCSVLALTRIENNLSVHVIENFIKESIANKKLSKASGIFLKNENKEVEAREQYLAIAENYQSNLKKLYVNTGELYRLPGSDTARKTWPFWLGLSVSFEKNGTWRKAIFMLGKNGVAAQIVNPYHTSVGLSYEDLTTELSYINDNNILNEQNAFGLSFNQLSRLIDDQIDQCSSFRSCPALPDYVGGDFIDYEKAHYPSTNLGPFSPLWLTVERYELPQ